MCLAGVDVVHGGTLASFGKVGISNNGVSTGGSRSGSGVCGREVQRCQGRGVAFTIADSATQDDIFSTILFVDGMADASAGIMALDEIFRVVVTRLAVGVDYRWGIWKTRTAR